MTMCNENANRVEPYFVRTNREMRRKGDALPWRTKELGSQRLVKAGPPFNVTKAFYPMGQSFERFSWRPSPIFSTVGRASALSTLNGFAPIQEFS